MNGFRCLPLVVMVALPAIVIAADPSKAGGSSKNSGQKIASAMSAAPMAISKQATIMDYPATPDGKPIMLRKGSNGWTCFPDNAGTPGKDPMCLDKQWMTWLEAYLNKTSPNITAVGIGYMLQGGSDASNTDPFADKPAAGQAWVKAPPHIMVIAPGKLDPAMFSSDPHSGEHWIMFGGTPYEHLMIPVK